MCRVKTLTGLHHLNRGLILSPLFQAGMEIAYLKAVMGAPALILSLLQVRREEMTNRLRMDVRQLRLMLTVP